MEDFCDKTEKTAFISDKSLIQRKLLSLGALNHYSAATLELTHRCNASCRYCYISPQKGPDLSLQQIYYIIDKLSDAGILLLSFTGGEPFIRDDFLDIMNYAITKDFWKIGIMSNGTLVKQHHIDFLKNSAAYISSIQFSAFSHVPSVHDSYTGIPGSLEKLLSVASALKESNIPVKIAINILGSNYATFEDSVSYFTSAGFQVTWSVHKVITETSSESLQTTLREETSLEFYKKFIDTLSDEHIRKERSRYLRLKETVTTVSPRDMPLCRGLFSNLYIDSEGFILPCVSFRSMRIGSIFQNKSLHEIIDSSKELRKLKTMRIADIPKCASCRYNTVCHICVGMNHTENGSVQEPCMQQCHYTYALATFFGLEHGETLK